jgi:hypothetical protein
MKKTIRVVKSFKIVKRSCSLNRYYRVVGDLLSVLDNGPGLDVKSDLYLLLSDLKIVTPTNRCVAVINLISCIFSNYKCQI